MLAVLLAMLLQTPSIPIPVVDKNRDYKIQSMIAQKEFNDLAFKLQAARKETTLSTQEAKSLLSPRQYSLLIQGHPVYSLDGQLCMVLNKDRQITLRSTCKSKNP